MILNETVVFIFITIMNALLFSALVMWVVEMFRQQEKVPGTITLALGLTACSFVEYLLIGGLLS